MKGNNDMLHNYPKVRLGIYLLSIVAQIASFFVAITAPEYGDAFSQTAAVLAAIGLTTAVSNVGTVEK